MENTMKKMLEKLWQMCKERIDSLIMKLVEDGKSSNLESDYILLFDSHKIPNRVGHDHMTYFDFREFLKWLRKMFDNYYTKTAVDAKLKNLKDYVDENICTCVKPEEGNKTLKFYDGMYLDGQDVSVVFDNGFTFDDEEYVLIPVESESDITANEIDGIKMYVCNPDSKHSDKLVTGRGIIIFGWNACKVMGKKFDLTIKNEDKEELHLNLVCTTEEVILSVQGREDEQVFIDGVAVPYDEDGVTGHINRHVFHKSMLKRDGLGCLYAYEVNHRIKDKNEGDCYCELIDVYSTDSNVAYLDNTSDQKLPIAIDGWTPINIRLVGIGECYLYFKTDCDEIKTMRVVVNAADATFMWMNNGEAELDAKSGVVAVPANNSEGIVFDFK